MERKFNSKTQRNEGKKFERKSFSKDTPRGNRRNDKKSGNKTVIKKAKFLIGPMLPSKTGVLASLLLKNYRVNNYLIDEEFYTNNKKITDAILDTKINFENKLLEIFHKEKNCIIRDNYYKNVFYNLTAIILTKEFEQLKKWSPSYLGNIEKISSLFDKNEATKVLAERINNFCLTAKGIINKGKIEGSDKEAIKEAIANINIDGVDTTELGYIQKDLVEKFKYYMENPLEFSSIHVGLPNFANCVLFFEKPIDEVLLTSLPTDFRKILFTTMYNFKLFNTDNIAIINRPILDVMLDEGENEYTKLSDPALLKKPVKEKKPFNKNNKFGGKKNGYVGKSKEFSKSWK